MANIKGIDISLWQGAPDFEKVKASGIEFVIARAGYGKNNIDKQFRRTAAECNRLGIPLGVYWFSYASTPEEAAKEALYCLAAVAPYKLDYPIFFDLEYDTVANAKKKGVTIDQDLASRMVEAFCTAVENAGYWAANYTNLDYIRRMFSPEIVSRYALWYAWYNKDCNRVDAGLWQYSSTGSVPGIVGNVDMNIDRVGYPEKIKAASMNGYAPEAPTAPAAPAAPETPTAPAAVDYPADTPDWQKEGFELLVKRGVITSPDTWKQRFKGTMTVGEIMGLIGRL